MFGFHFMMFANYTFALVQIERSEEVLVVWFFQILFNSICIIVLYIHAIYAIVRTFLQKSKDKKVKKSDYERVGDLNSEDVNDYDVD